MKLSYKIRVEMHLVARSIKREAMCPWKEHRRRYKKNNRVRMFNGESRDKGGRTYRVRDKNSI